MVTLYMPPSLRYFEPMRVLPNARTEFMSLEYDLVEALRPKLIVDVGAGDAQSYFTFCQSVRDHDVDGLCYAVDEWADEEEKRKGPEDESRYASINHFAHSELRGIAYLLQMTAEHALMHFDRGMVQLLRVDVARLGGPIAKLIEDWLPRVAPGGILLCPGTSTESGAGIERELSRRGGRVWRLSQKSGLMLWRADGGAPPDSLPELIRMAFFGTVEEQEALARWYQHAADHHQVRTVARTLRWGIGAKKNPRKQ